MLIVFRKLYIFFQRWVSHLKKQTFCEQSNGIVNKSKTMAEEKRKIEFVDGPCRIKPRKFPAQNIVLRLRRRETIGCQYPGTQVLVARQFYQNVFPNFTVVNVEKPPCFLRKFSPDGRFLVAFSADQTSIEVYKYEGASAAAKLLVDCKDEYIGHKNDDKNFRIRNNIFHHFFKVNIIN